MENKEEKKLPERKKTFKIEGNSYEVEFPNTGGLIEIEILKSQLSRNQYAALAANTTDQGSYSRFLVDMIAVFTVLFPLLKKDMNVKTISELNGMDSKKLLKVYLNEVLPWMNQWFDALNTDDDEVAKTA